MNSSVWFRISRPVWRPSEFILALIAGPIPWNLPTGSTSTKTGPISGAMTYWPWGLRWSESFARNSDPELPTYVASEQRHRSCGRSFGSRRLAQTALQLFEPIGETTAELPRFAVVR
jgi:hypothetical protein